MLCSGAMLLARLSAADTMPASASSPATAATTLAATFTAATSMAATTPASMPASAPTTQEANELRVPILPGEGFTPDDANYRAQTAALYEKEYLGKTVGQLAAAAQLNAAEKVKARVILRTFIDDWLESYVAGKGRISRTDVDFCLAMMDERFRGELSQNGHNAYMAWRTNATEAHNALAFLMNPRFAAPTTLPTTTSAPASGPASMPASGPTTEPATMPASAPASRPGGTSVKYFGVGALSFDAEHLVLRGGFEITGPPSQWYGVFFRLTGEPDPNLPVRDIEKSWNNLFLPDSGVGRWSDIRLSFRRAEFMLLLNRGQQTKIWATMSVYDHGAEKNIDGGAEARTALLVTTNADGKIVKVETALESASQPASAPASGPASAPASQPSSQPETQPTTFPSTMPSSAPATAPASQPATGPASQPATRPETQPATSPSTMPSSAPTSASAPASRPA